MSVARCGAGSAVSVSASDKEGKRTLPCCQCTRKRAASLRVGHPCQRVAVGDARERGRPLFVLDLSLEGTGWRYLHAGLLPNLLLCLYACWIARLTLAALRGVSGPRFFARRSLPPFLPAPHA